MRAWFDISLANSLIHSIHLSQIADNEILVRDGEILKVASRRGRNRAQEANFAAHFVPGMMFDVFDLGLCCSETRSLPCSTRVRR